jgi:hypothetical protein
MFGRKNKMKYKKYIVFRFNIQFPSGGVGDIEKDFDTIEEALEKFPENYYANTVIQIVDRDTWIVEKEYRTK